MGFFIQPCLLIIRRTNFKNPVFQMNNKMEYYHESTGMRHGPITCRPSWQ